MQSSLNALPVPLPAELVAARLYCAANRSSHLQFPAVSLRGTDRIVSLRPASEGYGGRELSRRGARVARTASKRIRCTVLHPAGGRNSCRLANLQKTIV